MPYIESKERQRFDTHIEAIVKELQNSLGINWGGEINYIFSRIMDATFAKGGYYQRSQGVNTLECCKLEFYRRALADYEDEKIKANGDVYFQKTKE